MLLFHRFDDAILEQIHFMVQTAMRQQFLMRAAFDDFAVMENQDQVCILDRAQPMRNRYRRPSDAHAFQTLLDRYFCFGIDICGCFIEHQDFRVGCHRSCERHQLALPT